MALSDDAHDIQNDRLLAESEAKVADARRERDAARTALKQVSGELDDMQARMNLIEGIIDFNPQPPKWLSPKKRKAGSRGIVVTMLSDAHFDEVVDPKQMGGVNAYNRDIATQRLERYFSKVIELSRDHLAGLDFDGCVLSLNGDLFSGDIHEELVETNEDTTLGSVLYWLEHLAAGIDQLADEFGKVHVPVTVGNHGRRTRKPRKKLKVRDNFDWLMGCLVAREFRDDNRVTFDIPETAGCQVDVYDRVLRFEHGDNFRGGNGIAGIWSPISRGEAKRSKAQSQIKQPFDLICLGHFHQLIFGQSWVINGSNKGYDEYAFDSGFLAEPPQQAMWVETPEHGMTWRGPVIVGDRKAEGW